MINKVILIGNVGVDPEIRTLESGVKVARVRLATTEHTEWHTITLWRGLADVVDKYVRKGSQIYVEGRIRTREWTDQSGAKRYSTEILADTMNLLGRRSDSPQQGAAPQSGYQQAAPAPAYQQAPAYQAAPAPIPADDPDDLPF